MAGFIFQGWFHFFHLYAHDRAYRICSCDVHLHFYVCDIEQDVFRKILFSCILFFWMQFAQAICDIECTYDTWDEPTIDPWKNIVHYHEGRYSQNVATHDLSHMQTKSVSS